MTNATQTPTEPKPKKPCGCGGKGSAHPGQPCACGCATTPCFERPRFFAGQLLSDTDLSAEQKYVREKQKLYHRTLHGHGVVCGLRLTCDGGCCGHVRIGDGYAIDDCGNDIVVCDPYSFDAIGLLREKGWLVESPHHHHGPHKPDPSRVAGRQSRDEDCDEREKEPRCDTHQCFHLAICYDEKPSCFTTPFKTTCGPNAAGCEPTRVKETFRIDLLKEMPERYNPMKHLEDRVAACWRIFTQGDFFKSFGGALKRLVRALGGQPREAGPTDRNAERELSLCDIFCQLQTFFLHHLQRCPDLYDCTLPQQVCELKCCGKDAEEFNPFSHPIVRLCMLVRRYVYEAILGEMIFTCAHPCDAKCVVLGSISIENGCLSRVCNCPREYVKTFPNFFQTMVATLVGGRACGEEECDDHDDDSPQAGRQPGNTAAPRRPARDFDARCCNDFEEFDVENFVRLFDHDSDWAQRASATPSRVGNALLRWIEKSLDFTHPLALTKDALVGKGSSGPLKAKTLFDPAARFADILEMLLVQAKVNPDRGEKAGEAPTAPGAPPNPSADASAQTSAEAGARQGKPPKKGGQQ